MRRVGAVTGATVVAAAMIPCSGATASADEWPPPLSRPVALNGTYRATSDGNWAKLNHQFYDQESVTSTWTITSTCSSSAECSGQVSSDQGWSAALNLVGGGLWRVSRDVENYQRCPDGTTFPGRQQFKFYPSDDNNLRGWDETLGPSGACGLNAWVLIEMPFTLVKID